MNQRAPAVDLRPYLDTGFRRLRPQLQLALMDPSFRWCGVCGSTLKRADEGWRGCRHHERQPSVLDDLLQAAGL